MPETLSDEERLNRAVKSFRTLIRDKKELNRLLGGKFESNDDEAKMAIMASLLDWNTTPPFLAPVGLHNHPAKQLLIQNAALIALQGAGIWHSRERLPSSDGGTSADDHAKAGEYDGWINRFYQDYEKKKADMKLAMNITQALTDQGLPSEYGLWSYVFGYFW